MQASLGVLNQTVFTFPANSTAPLNFTYTAPSVIGKRIADYLEGGRVTVRRSRALGIVDAATSSGAAAYYADSAGIRPKPVLPAKSEGESIPTISSNYASPHTISSPRGLGRR